MKVYIHPNHVDPETGIGQVVIAQLKHLPNFGVEIVGSAEAADVIACHVLRQTGIPRVDVLHSHGLYMSDIPHVQYYNWHININREIARSAREATTVTVPSDWVAQPFRRDMRIQPAVIGHGIDLGEWQELGESKGYVLWNKGRNRDVCDPTPAFEIARDGVEVVSTFAPISVKDKLPNFHDLGGVIGHEKMKALVKNAGIYLATTIETFGIGTLEAMAAGVPVVGYRWGGTEMLVRNGVDGILVEPGDITGLKRAVSEINNNNSLRLAMRNNCIKRAHEFAWENVMQQYVDVYEHAYEKRQGFGRVTVVITNYNYGKYIKNAMDSVYAQTDKPEALIVVDDCSTDDSVAVIEAAVTDAVKTTVIKHERNAGVASARNDGIAAADTDLITCLDADDIMHANFIADLRPELVRDRGLGIAYTGLAILNSDGSLSPSNFPPEFNWEIQAAGGVPPANCIPSANMFRRDMWLRSGGVKQQYAPGEDAEFWTRGLSIGFNARRVTNNPWFIYRSHAAGASKTRKYIPIDYWHPWMRDKQYPFAAPTNSAVKVYSYAMPLASVIVPVGPGHGRHMKTALESVIGQTLRDLEVVVVADVTGPELEDMKAVLANTYPFVRLLETGGGAGAGRARNIGLAAAKAPLSVFLDADDYLHPEYLEKCLNKISANEGKYVYTDYFAVDGSNQQKPVQTNAYDARLWLENPEAGNGITVMIATADARKVGFDESLPTFEDVDFFSRCAIMGIQGVRVPEPLFFYRTHTGTRRPNDEGEALKLTDTIRARYRDYLTGAKKMSGCCGGGAAIQEFIRIKNQIAGEPEPVKSIAIAENKMVRLEFIGETVGAITFRVNGHEYRGGNNNFDRYVDAAPDDVEKLVITGKWKIIREPAPAAPQDEYLAKIEEPVDIKMTAEAALLKAKASFDAEEFTDSGIQERVPSPQPEPKKTEPEPEPVKPPRKVKRQK